MVGKFRDRTVVEAMQVDGTVENERAILAWVQAADPERLPRALNVRYIVDEEIDDAEHLVVVAFRGDQHQYTWALPGHWIVHRPEQEDADEYIALTDEEFRGRFERVIA